MSFSGTLSIADEANSAKSFVEIERASRKARRIETTSTPALPLQMVIDHNEQGKPGGVQSTRHFVQFAKTVEDSNGVAVTTIVNLTVTVPYGATAGDPEELLGYLINFLIGTNAARALDNVDNLLLGES